MDRTKKTPGQHLPAEEKDDIRAGHGDEQPGQHHENPIFHRFEVSFLGLVGYGFACSMMALIARYLLG